MNTLPENNAFDPNVFAAVIADRRFVAAVAISLLAGTVRGFSGFGAALVYIPLVAAVYSPRVAAATLMLIDFVSSFPFAVRALPLASWHQVIPIMLGAMATLPVGALALLLIDPVLLRWIIAALVIAALAALASGWRYHGRPRLPAGLLVGGLSGLTSGAAQMGGAPVVIYWLGGDNPIAMVRANLLVLFMLLGAYACAAYWVEGLITHEVLILSPLLAPPYLLAMAFGARLFHGASERTYRRVAFAIIAAGAAVSLPLFDNVFR